MESAYPARSAMRGRVGMVIPAWFGAQTPVSEAELLLRTTLADSPSCLNPRDVVVVVDGSPVASAAARSLHQQLGEEWGAPFELIELPENRGKGGALVEGFRFLLDRPAESDPLAWIAVRDADGDHLLDDLPHLYRTGEQLRRASPSPTRCARARR